MKINLFYCLFVILFLVSCNVNQKPDISESSGDLTKYTWIKFNLQNYTDNTVDMKLSGINIRFNLDNGVRTPDTINNNSYHFFVPKITDMQKFEETFQKEVKDGTLYKVAADNGSNTAEDIAAMNYKNPLWDLYELYDEQDQTSYIYKNDSLSAKSSQTYYCVFYWEGAFNVSQLFSVKMDLDFISDNKISLLGWEKQTFELDNTSDTNLMYNLDIWHDLYNPAKSTAITNQLSKFFLNCHYAELTVLINGDTTNDIAVTDNTKYKDSVDD